MTTHPYYNAIVACLVFLTFLAAVDLVILGLWLWAQRRNTLAAVAAVAAFERNTERDGGPTA